VDPVSRTNDAPIQEQHLLKAPDAPDPSLEDL